MSTLAPATTAPVGAVAGPERSRLLGIDMARTLAIVGMVVAHLAVRPLDDPWGGGDWVAAGRSSALFALLAGVSVALVTGRETPLRGSALGQARLSLTVRAVLIYLLGLGLGVLDSGIAVILPAYGAMFLLAVAFVHLPERRLRRWAIGWVLLAPWVTAPLRAWVADPASALHRLPDHGAWISTTAHLVLTGAYPVVVWFGYVLAGMAVGRLDLTRRETQRGLLALGSLGAAGAWITSRWFTSLPEVRERLLATWQGSPAQDFTAMDRMARQGMHGQSPSDWTWQLTLYPHSSTLLDLVHTVGTSVAVIGGCLLLVSSWPRLTTLWGLLGAIGAMSLTAYCLHLLLRTFYDASGDHGAAVLAVHLVLIAAVALPLHGLGRRGPLELLVSRACAHATRLLTRH